MHYLSALLGTNGAKVEENAGRRSMTGLHEWVRVGLREGGKAVVAAKDDLLSQIYKSGRGYVVNVTGSRPGLARA
jgi:hypothetical protein